MAASEPGREEKLSAAIGLVDAGHSLRHASALTGIPRATIHENYLKYLGPDAPDKDAARKATDERILAGAACIAEATLGEMANRIAEGKADNATITAWHSVSAKTYGRLRGWDRDGVRDDAQHVDRWGELLGRVLDQGGATMTVKLERNSDDSA